MPSNDKGLGRGKPFDRVNKRLFVISDKGLISPLQTDLYGETRLRSITPDTFVFNDSLVSIQSSKGCFSRVGDMQC